MDNEELTNMLLACIEKLKDASFEVDFQTECNICKVADSILNGVSITVKTRKINNSTMYGIMKG